MQIELLIASRDERLGLALRQRLAQEEASGIAIRTTGLPSLLVKVAADRPDVLLLERTVCGDEPHQVLLPLMQLSPDTQILLLCESCRHDLMLDFIRLGASGCVLTSDPPSLVIKAVRSVHAGETWFEHSSLLEALHSLIDNSSIPHAPLEEGRLTQREEEIFDLIGRGLTNKEIGRELDISDLTVKTHLHRIYVKLHQSGRRKALFSHPTRPQR